MAWVSWELIERIVKNDAPAHERVQKIKVNRALKDVDEIKEVLREVTGLAASDRAKSDLELLAEAVQDPTGVEQDTILRDRLFVLFESHKEVVDKVEQLDKRISVVEKSPTATAGIYHHRLDVIRDKINAGKHEVAIDNLDDLVSSAGRSLSHREQYRISMLYGHALLGLDQKPDAISKFKRASDFEKDSIDGKSALAYAKLLEGNNGEAYGLVDEIIDEPESAIIAWFVWIRSQDDVCSFDTIEQRIPERMLDEADILNALSMLATGLEEYDSAIRFAKIAVEKKPGNPDFRYVLALALLEKERKACFILDPCEVVLENRKNVEEACEHFDKALELCDDDLLRSELLLNRSRCHSMLGNDEAAGSDVEAARVFSSTSSTTRFQHALALFDRKQWDEAAKEFQAIPEEERHPSFPLIYAKTLAWRDAPGDKNESLGILSKALEDGVFDDVVLQIDILEAYYGIALTIDAQDTVLEVLRNIKGDVVLPVAADIFAFNHKCKAVDGEELIESADAILDQVEEAKQIPINLYAAKAFNRAGLSRHTFRALKEVIAPNVISNQARLLLECAAECDEVQFVLGFCKSMRDNGLFDTHCLNIEINVLIKYNINGAIELLQEIISLEVADEIKKYCNLRLSLIGLSVGRNDLVVEHENDLPSPSSVNPIIGQAVVEILRHQFGLDCAGNYAYKLIRRYPDSLEAHRAIVGTYINLDGEQEEYVAPETISAGNGFIYRVAASGDLRWYIVEDETDSPISRSRGEISVEDAQKLGVLGLSVGDTFVLNTGGIQDRQCEIREIMPKAVRRFQHSTDNWETLFPGDDKIHRVVLQKDDDGNINIDSVIHALENRKEFVNKLVEYSREIGLSATHIANLGGRTTFQTSEFLSSRPDIGIRVSNGDQLEYERGMQAFSCSEAFVLDELALWTLYSLNCIEILHKLPQKPLVTQGTWVGVHEEVRQRKMATRSAGVMSTHNGEAIFQEASRQVLENELDKIRSFLEAIGECCEVLNAMDLATLPEEARRRLESESVNQGVAESIALAKERDAAYWVDDFAVGVIAQAHWGVKRVWTQIVLTSLEENGNLSSFESHELQLRLLTLNYRFTRMTPARFKHACLASSWNPNEVPLKNAISHFVSPTINIHTMRRLIGPIFAQIWQAPSDEIALELSRHVLDQYKSHPYLDILLSALHSYIERGLGGIPASRYRSKMALFALYSWLSDEKDVLKMIRQHVR